MKTKRINEYFSIMLNGRMRTVLIERELRKFDNLSNVKDDAEIWMNYIDNVIKDVFNTNEWSYLGSENNFTPEEKEKVLTIKID